MALPVHLPQPHLTAQDENMEKLRPKHLSKDLCESVTFLILLSVIAKHPNTPLSVFPHRPCLLVCPFYEMRIYLIPPYLASTKCLWRQTMEIVMGGQNCCIGLASVSFSIHLTMPWCCIVAKTHTGYVYGCLRVPVSLGGICLPLTGLQAVTDPNTLF